MESRYFPCTAEQREPTAEGRSVSEPVRGELGEIKAIYSVGS